MKLRSSTVSLKAKAAAKTDVGLVRRSNQDSFGLDDESGLYVVCDGMGGAIGGEIASNLAVQSFLTTAKQELAATTLLNGERNRDCLLRATLAANRTVRMRAEYDTRYRGMGTTLVGARLEGDDLSVVNVGDSRAYLVRDGEAEQLTSDHSYVAESVRMGTMTAEEALRSHLQSVITRAIGAEDDVDPEIFQRKVQAGDTLLLVSDGLTRHVSDEQIGKVVSTPNQSGVESCRLLIEMAKDDGGSDNITCLVVKISDDVKGERTGFMLRWK